MEGNIKVVAENAASMDISQLTKIDWRTKDENDKRNTKKNQTIKKRKEKKRKEKKTF